MVEAELMEEDFASFLVVEVVGFSLVVCLVPWALHDGKLYLVSQSMLL